MTLNLTIGDGVAELTLARPDVGNALDLPTALALQDAVREVAGRGDVRALVLASSGPLFCAGGDVRAMAAATDRGVFVHELATAIHDALVALRRLPVPVVAAVHATAAGAGIGLVLAADIVLAADSAKFISAYDRIGLTPDCGVSALLPAAVGSRRAALFTLTNLVLDAPTALDWGLISEVCPPDALSERVRVTVAALAARPDNELGETARLLRAAAERTYALQLADEADTIARLASGDAAAALIDAFSRR